MQKSAREMLKVIDGVHMHHISSLEMRFLAALECGYNTDEIATGFGVRPETVRRHFAELEQRVFDGTELVCDRCKLRTWVRRRFCCCTREAEELIENDQVFARTDQRKYR